VRYLHKIAFCALPRILQELHLNYNSKKLMRYLYKIAFCALPYILPELHLNNNSKKLMTYQPIHNKLNINFQAHNLLICIMQLNEP